MPEHAETVPIRFESLPTPLRAVLRDRADGSLRIEAELPWLAIGTVVHGGPAGGIERTAQVTDFDVEVTSGGSARLVILAAPHAAGSPALGASPAPPRPGRRLGKLLLGAIVIGAAALAGYVVGQLSSPAIELESPWPARGTPAAASLPAPPAPSLAAEPGESPAPASTGHEPETAATRR